MKITVFVLCLVTVGALSDSAQAAGASAAKRDSTDGASNKSSKTESQSTQQYSNGYAALGSYGSATTPQLFYAKPEGGIQYASGDYKGPIVGPAQFLIPQFALAPQSPDIKSHGHIPLSYPGPIQYFALAPPLADIKHPGHAIQHPGILPYQGHPMQFALAPYPHPVSQLVRGGGITYAGPIPQMAYFAAPQVAPVPAPIAKVEAPVPVQPTATALAAPQPASAYAYSIQPSIQIAAGKQIVTPTVATPHFKQLVPPPATSYATFSQQLPVATAAPVKVGQVISHHHAYPTAPSTLYPSSKVSYRSVGHDIADFYSQPGSFNYGSHLYHPSPFAKFAPFFGPHKYQ